MIYVLKIIPKKAIAFFCFMVLFSSFPSFSNNSTTIAPNRFEQSNSKIYIHFDRSDYSAADTIWFKLYLVNAHIHQPQSSAEIVYIDLISPSNKTIASRILKTTDGFGEGDFKLPFDIPKGNYTISAYTRAMLDDETTHFFQKSLYIGSTYYVSQNEDSTESNEPKLDVQFLPEGGTMVNGFINQIAFKVLGENGLGIDVNGTIVDQDDNKILEFKTSKFGMGILQLTPEEGKAYKAIISYNGVDTFYDLPKALDTGVVIKLIAYKDYFGVNILSSLKKGLNGFSFTVKQREGLVYSGKIKGTKSKSIVKIPKNVLNPGVFQFTLYDENENPICERLAFHEVTKDDLEVFIAPSKLVYDKQALVTLDVNKSDSNSKEAIVYASMSVTKTADDGTDNNTFNIKTYLLLNSELRGKIENPNYYFYSEDPKRRNDLDILMMTQRWRTFLTQEPKQEKTSIERGITIKGTLKSSKRKKSLITGVTLAYRNKDEIGYDETVTDAEGNFSFKDLDFADTTTVLIKTKTYREDLSIALDSSIPFKKNSSSKIVKTIPDLLTNQDQGTNKNVTRTEYSLLTDKDIIRLEEVEVQARKKEKEDRFKKKRLLYSSASHTIDFSELPQNYGINPLQALIGRIPGFSASGSLRLRASSSFNRSGNKILFLLDGTPVYDIEAILAIPFADVDFIDVLKGPKATIYGSRASGGVIAIYTKDGSNDSSDSDVSVSVNFKHPGFYNAREFYVPRYDTSEVSPIIEDPRKSTLFWEPALILNNSTSAISFLSSDLSGIYKVVLEGISDTGEPVFATTTYEIQ